LVRRLRRDPVRGSGRDADGKAHRLIVDEEALLGILYNNYSVDTDNRLEATVTVNGPDGENGTLTIDATLWDPAQPTATLRGHLRHHDIAFTTQTR
jgi:hypothetical protein